MTNLKINRKLGSAHRIEFRRADGSVRQAEIVDIVKNMNDTAYFIPGTLLKPGNTFEVLVGKRCYHWASSYTDEELKSPGRIFGYTDEEIVALRKEAAYYDKHKIEVDKPRREQWV